VIGETLAGYKIEKKLGQGGMGAVFRVVSPEGEKCAMKLLALDLSGDLKARSRFKHECRVLRELDHPRIVRALSDLVEQAERSFYVMELVKGEDLGKRLDRSKQLPVDDSIAIVEDVLEALEAAHAKGILHRDVKPSNVFVEESGRAKLGDFGIAFVAGATRLTRPGTTLGTPEFMAPELARGEEPTVRTDLYAVGILLWMLIEGKPPFEASNPLAILKKQIEEPLPAPSAKVPARVAAVLARALAKKPEERFASADEFRRALGAEKTAADVARAATKPTRTPSVGRAAAPTKTPSGPRPPKARKTSEPAPSVPDPPAAAPRREVIVVAVLLLVLFVGSITGVALLVRSKPRGPRILVHLRGGDALEGELVKLDTEADVLIVHLANGTEQRLPLGDVASYEKLERPR